METNRDGGKEERDWRLDGVALRKNGVDEAGVPDGRIWDDGCGQVTRASPALFAFFLFLLLFCYQHSCLFRRILES